MAVWVICSYLAIMGLGLGMSMQILVLIVQNTFPVTEVGTATASNNYFRQIGASLGSAIVGSLFVAKLTQLLTERMPAGAASAGGGENSLTPAVVRNLPARHQGRHRQLLQRRADARSSCTWSRS